MNANLADVTIHIDETLTHNAMEKIRDAVVGSDGVGSASFHDNQPHMMMVLYDPNKLNSHKLLGIVESKGVHAELIGL